MSHTVKSCPQTRLLGGLSKLHSADDDAVAWLTSYAPKCIRQQHYLLIYLSSAVIQTLHFISKLLFVAETLVRFVRMIQTDSVRTFYVSFNSCSSSRIQCRLVKLISLCAEVTGRCYSCHCVCGSQAGRSSRQCLCRPNSPSSVSSINSATLPACREMPSVLLLSFAFVQ